MLVAQAEVSSSPKGSAVLGLWLRRWVVVVVVWAVSVVVVVWAVSVVVVVAEVVGVSGKR